MAAQPIPLSDFLQTMRLQVRPDEYEAVYRIVKMFQDKHISAQQLFQRITEVVGKDTIERCKRIAASQRANSAPAPVSVPVPVPTQVPVPTSNSPEPSGVSLSEMINELLLDNAKLNGLGRNPRLHALIEKSATHRKLYDTLLDLQRQFATNSTDTTIVAQFRQVAQQLLGGQVLGPPPMPIGRGRGIPLSAYPAQVKQPLPSGVPTPPPKRQRMEGTAAVAMPKPAAKRGGGRGAGRKAGDASQTEEEAETVDIKQLNDVTRIAKIDLREETGAHFVGMGDEVSDTELRPRLAEEEVPFVDAHRLRQKIQKVVEKQGIRPQSATEDIVRCMAQAVHIHMTNLIEQLIELSHIHTDLVRDNVTTEVTHWPRRIIQDVSRKEQTDREQKQNEEKERILQAAKELASKKGGKGEVDPEMRERVKRFQEEDKRGKETSAANTTALQAIGNVSIKKHVLPGGSGTFPSLGTPMIPFERRMRDQPRRIALKELLYLMEAEPTTRKSPLLYRTYLRLAMS